MFNRFLSLVACFLGVAATAHAQPDTSRPASAEGTEVAPAAESAEPDVPAGILEDASSGRVWVMPTALLPPKGTWSLDNYEVVFVGGSYAFTDSFQLSGAATVPTDAEGPELTFLTAKLGLLALERFHLAVQGTTLVDREERIGSLGTLLGGVASLCLDRDCHSLLNGYAGAGFSILGDESSVPLVLSVSLMQRISSHVKLLLEVDSGLILNPIYEEDRGILANYGLRITSRNISVDLGLLRPFCPDCDGDGGFPLGLPFLALSYRGI